MWLGLGLGLGRGRGLGLVLGRRWERHLRVVEAYGEELLHHGDELLQLRRREL